MSLPKTQTCPYCDYEVEDARANWEEEVEEVKCDYCNRMYSVRPIYEFIGFEVQKVCDTCNEVEDDCGCCLKEGEEK